MGIGHSKQFAGCAVCVHAATSRANVITHVDVACNDHTIKRRFNIFEVDHGLILGDLVVCRFQFRLGRLLVGILHRNGLTGHSLRLPHGPPACGGYGRQTIFGLCDLEVCLCLSIFRIQPGGIDFGQEVALFHHRAIITVPHFHIARDLCINGSFVPCTDCARQSHGESRWRGPGLHQSNIGHPVIGCIVLNTHSILGTLDQKVPNIRHHDSHKKNNKNSAFARNRHQTASCRSVTSVLDGFSGR